MGIGRMIVYAGIVVFNPDLKVLRELISAIECQVDRVVIFNNGGCSDADLNNACTQNNHILLGDKFNKGIAYALNEICLTALDSGADYALTFDQDSAPIPHIVRLLIDQIEILKTSGIRVSAVGPLFTDARSGGDSMPVFFIGALFIKKIKSFLHARTPIEASFLITSGMLIDIKAWKRIGRFRDDFFIDYVDTEWCLRGGSLGYRVFCCPSIVMPHRLSDESPARIFGRLVLKYSPVRRYYAFRNAVALARLHHCPFPMKIYLLGTLVYRLFLNAFIDSQKCKSILLMILGVIHGISGRLGPK